MIEYIHNIIIIPYINHTQKVIEDDTPALINLKGHVTSDDLLGENDIHVCLLPVNMTDGLQPMDIHVSVNKPTKTF